MRPDGGRRVVIAAALTLALIGASLLSATRIHSTSPAALGSEPFPLPPNARHELTRYRFLRRGLRFGVPPDAYRKAVAQMRLMPRVRAESLLAPDPSWTFIGPQPMLGEGPSPIGEEPGDAVPPLAAATGRLTAIVADPTTSRRIFVGAASGGVWMSTDSGATFVPIGDSLPTQATGALALDPTTTPPTLYVGTGEANNSDDSLYGQGIFVSSDLGQSWSPRASGAFANNGFARLAIDTSHSPSHLFAAVDGLVFSDSRGIVMPSEGSLGKEGLWRSTDGGVNWTQYPVATFGCAFTSNTVPCPAADVAIDPSNANNVYASFLLTNPTAYRSTDGGATWQAISFPGPSGAASISRASLAVGSPAPGAPACSSGAPCGVLYAMVGAADSTYLGFFKSTDGGGIWTSGVVPCVTTTHGTFDGNASAF